MPIDHSIYLQQKGLDVFGNAAEGFEQGMRMSDLARQRRVAEQADADKQGIRNIFKTRMGPDGKLDPIAMSEIAAIDPEKGFALRKDLSAQEATDYAFKQKKEDDDRAFIAREAGGVTDQPSLDRALERARARGMDVSQIPPTFTPGLGVKLQKMSMSAAEQVAMRQKDDELQIKRDEVKRKAGAAPKGSQWQLNPQTGEMELAPIEDKQVVKDRREFNLRHTNIAGELEKVKSLIDKKGTYEMFGSHNKDLAQMIDSIAIDSAKMFDPQSVARESEVAAFKKMLFEPGTWTTRNSTAKQVLESYKEMLARRAENYAGQYGPDPKQSVAQREQLRTEVPKTEAEAEAASQYRQARIAELRAKQQKSQVAGGRE